MNLTPLPTLRVSRHHIPQHGLIPNSTATSKPLLIYHSCFSFPSPSATSPSPSPSSLAEAIESHLTHTGVVVPQWRYTMYTTTHFHSTTHEVLSITSGQARLCFGGEANPGKVEVVVGAGDVVVVPAGVGHRLLEDLSTGDDGGGFEMVGSYPPGKHWDMCYGKAGEESKVSKIAGLGWFDRDPVYGDDGPVLDV